MNAEEITHYRWLLCRIEEGGNDGADIYDFEAFALAMLDKYGTPAEVAKHAPDVQAWEHGLFNDVGMFGPTPRVGLWLANGFMIESRDMTKEEQLAELFPASRSDWEGFRAWLAKTNPLEMRCLDRWCEGWQHNSIIYERAKA